MGGCWEWLGEALEETLGRTSGRSWSLSALCCLTLQLHVRDEESAQRHHVSSSKPCPPLFPPRVCEIGAPVVAGMNFTDEAQLDKIRTWGAAFGVSAMNGFAAL